MARIRQPGSRGTAGSAPGESERLDGRARTVVDTSGHRSAGQWTLRVGSAMRVFAALAFVALMAACSSSSRSSSPTAATAPAAGEDTTVAPAPIDASKTSGHLTAAQVATLLAPLGCAAAPSRAASPLLFVGAVSELFCTIKGEQVTVDELGDASQLAAERSAESTQGCQRLEVGSDIAAAEGLNWSATAVPTRQPCPQLPAARRSLFITADCGPAGPWAGSTKLA